MSLRSAKLYATGEGGATPFCEVTVDLSAGPGSAITAVYRLPARWNGKVLGLGGGGLAGNVRLTTAAPALERGYATMQTDAGHPGTTVYDTHWAITNGGANVASIEDFAHRAIHLMTVSGKALVTDFYGQAARQAYFQGCSQGGRQGMEEAQRYPADYDGIISGAPAFDHIGSIASQSLSSRAFRDPAARLSPAKIALVHAAVLAQCDAADGLKDGIVEAPEKCGFDPAVLQCRAGNADDACLTKTQVEAVRNAYADHPAPDGEAFAYGLPRGSELSAFALYNDMAPTDAQEVIGVQNLAPALEFSGTRDLRTNDVVRDFWTARNSLFATLIQGDQPDLSRFVARGGKMLFWHGNYDQILSYRRFLDYYANLQRVTAAQLTARAGAPKLDESIRLFTLVGVGHCAGDIGPASLDTLGAMEAWVERGKAPATLLATRDKSPEDRPNPIADASQIQSRPACRWPALPHYKGKGDPNVASNFTCKI